MSMTFTRRIAVLGVSALATSVICSGPLAATTITGRKTKPMKMIISARRHPSLTRQAFFQHLQDVHWPLVRDNTRVAAAIGGYVQNHTLGDASPASNASPRIATERDSVIELYFENDAALQQMVALPEYQKFVRPDEARFNDLPANIMVKTAPELLFEVTVVGRCKRFDFLVRDQKVPGDQFRAKLKEADEANRLDPRFSGAIDRLVHNWPISAASLAQGFGEGEFDCVRESWAASFDQLSRIGDVSDSLELDRRSFTVFAREFVMIPPRGVSAQTATPAHGKH